MTLKFKRKEKTTFDVVVVVGNKKNVRFSSDIDGNPSALTNVTFDVFVLRIIVVSLLFFSSHIRHIYYRYIQDLSNLMRFLFLKISKNPKKEEEFRVWSSILTP